MSKAKSHVLFFAVLFVLASPLYSRAEGLSFSITPTIFDMAAMPGQAWDTSLKIVNNNPFELTVYATPVNFEPRGERGYGSFLPVAPTESNGVTLAEWMTVPAESIVIPKESSVALPVSIRVPADAAPGGHYAAIMVGTRPPERDGSLRITTSQIITSLFFVRIAGDVVEHGEVRTFRGVHYVTGKPEMAFELRFENKGNVHLLPRGEIVIKNMWGKERGIIPINQDGNFGNVLPESIRQFDFSWTGEASMFDIGRYKAELTLGYGTEEKKFTTRATAFWVIPVKPLLIFVVSIVAIVWFVTRSVRAYIRYMLRMSGIDPDATPTTSARPRYVLGEGDVRIERAQAVSVAAPVKAGVRDLRARLAGVHELFSMLRVVAAFIRSYRVFFISVLGFIALFVVVWWYLANVTTKHRDFEVTIDAGSEPTTLSSEEILHDRSAAPPAVHEAQATSTDVEGVEQSFVLNVVNAGSTPGQGGVVADILTAAGYTVDDLSADLEEERAVSAIIYDPSLEVIALDMSERLGGILPSAFADATASVPSITIYIGNDYHAE
jgi:hypothetical protein